MSDQKSIPNDSEDRSLSESQHRERHGGARPRHQNFSGARGGHHQQQRPRTYYSAHRSAEGNYRHSDHQSEQPNEDHRSLNSGQHYRGSQRPPFKYHQFGTHQGKRQDRNNKQSEPNESNSSDKPSSVHEDFSLLSVADQKQPFNSKNPETGFDTTHNSRGGRSKHSGLKPRGYNAYRSNRNDDSYLLKGVEEKQNWSDGHNSHTNYNHDKGNHRPKYSNQGNNFYSKTNNEISQPHVQEGPGPEDHRNRDMHMGDYEQFRWYGRRNYNPFGKQGTYRSYNEPVHDHVPNHYPSDVPQRTHNQHRHQRPYSGFHQNRDRRQQHTQRYQRSKGSGSNHADVEDDDATQRGEL